MPLNLFELGTELLACPDDSYGIVERASNAGIVDKASSYGLLDFLFSLLAKLGYPSAEEA